MNEQTDVLVIGGSAAGVVAATTAKSNYPDKDILVVRKEEEVLVPCGIPYIFGSLESSAQNIIPDAVLSKNDVRLKVAEVISIDQENKVCEAADGTEIKFDKLLLAIGSVPVQPKWLKGADKENVFTIPKDKVVIDKIRDQIFDSKKVVVVGGGFIGVEIADEINKLGKDVTLVEILPHILYLAFDDKLAAHAESLLESRGVTVRTGTKVEEILGDKKVESVLTAGGEKLETDAVILSIGYHPNVNLAKKAGIKINDSGFICVDEYMRTSNLDIFAVGDCAEKRGFITGLTKGIMLASTACAEAKIAGMSLYKLSAVKTFGGNISMFCTVIGDVGFGAAGVTENLANEMGFDIVTGTFEGIDRHPGTLAGTNKQIVKVIATRESGRLIGGEVIGGRSTGELTNLIGFAIQNRMTIDSVLTAQIATHPLLTAPPTAYPLIKAVEIATKNRKK